MYYKTTVCSMKCPVLVQAAWVDCSAFTHLALLRPSTLLRLAPSGKPSMVVYVMIRRHPLIQPCRTWPLRHGEENGGCVSVLVTRWEVYDGEFLAVVFARACRCTFLHLRSRTLIHRGEPKSRPSQWNTRATGGFLKNAHTINGFLIQTLGSEI